MDKTSFREYLEEQHAKTYTGSDDDMPDAFEKWLSELELEDWINFMEKQYLAWR